jgi:signal transduction histidine kinase
MEPAATDGPPPTDEHGLLAWSVALSTVSVGWAAAASFAGQWFAVLVAGGYVAATAFNLAWWESSGDEARARRWQATGAIVWALTLQVALGGWGASGGVGAWCLLPVLAMVVAGPRSDALSVGALAVGGGALAGAAELVAGSGPPVTPRLASLQQAAVLGCAAGLVALGAWERRAELEQHRRDASRVRQLNRDLLAAEQEARRANRAKSEFLASMSHELRTPLNAILGYAEILVDESDDAQVVVDSGRIVTSGTHLLSLINDILDLAKIEAGQMEPFLEPVFVDPLVDRLVKMVQPLADRSGNRLLVELDAPHAVMTDARMVEQMLLNLVSNSLKFTFGGTVRVRVRARAEHLFLDVADTGVGMTPEQCRRVVEPFQQARGDTTRDFGGTGLGLHLVSQFAELLGGELRISSKVGEGTRVTVAITAETVATAELLAAG